MDSSGSELHPVQQLADEFIERQDRGERPTIDEYAERFPALAEDIREVFPALVMIDQLAPADADLQQSGAALTSPDKLPQKQIGDYRILREIGRGGMGVVYEAEQESLGRRVALKVLLNEISASTRSMQRFQREARAAARMHHTNIVPVFEVGHEDDTAFYAMQLIQGQGLDLVIDDLKRIRREHSSLSDGKSAIRRRSVPAHSIAASLVSGEFHQEVLAAEVEADAAKSGHESSPAFTETIDQKLGSTTSAALPGESEISTAETNRNRFHRSVAQIGMQTADALAYAHARGIVHRDIKPSNLILDAGGVVWVTDFGLAKTDDEAMTHTGDILGTMRYMSPERFQGQCDVRADVYSLGLTLYELLVLKPAFESPDRLKLIEMVRQSDPPTPRSIDPRIPRDLETIVLKSIDKEPKRRYQSADDLSEDLRRFVDDEPINARRISIPERLIRWSRRHKGIAASLAAIALLLITLSLGSSFAATYYRESERTQRDLRDKEQAQRQKAEAAKSLAEQGQQEAQRQRAVARQRQYNTEIQLAHNEIRTGKLGSAAEILRSWIPAAQQQDFRGWEWYFLLQQSQQDVLSTFYGHKHLVWDLAWSPDSEHFATCSRDGVRVWHAPSGKEVKFLDGFTSQPWNGVGWDAVSNTLAVRLYGGLIYLYDGATFRESARIPTFHSPFGGISFSHDGKLLAFLESENKAVIYDHINREFRQEVDTRESDPLKDVCWSPVANQFAVISLNGVQIWTTEADAPMWRIQDQDGQKFAGGSWSPDGRKIAFALRAASEWKHVGIFDSQQGQPLGKLSEAGGWVAWNPDGTRIVTGGDGNAFWLWDAEERERLRAFIGHSGPVLDAAWSADGRYLASVSEDGTTRIWNTDESDRDKDLQGHEGAVRSVDWNPEGTLVASGSTDNTVRVWNVKSRECLHVLEGHSDVVEDVAWSRDGQRVASASRDKTVAIWDVRSGRRIHRIDHDAAVVGVDWSADGHQLASTSSSGSTSSSSPLGTVQLWNAHTGELVRELRGHIDKGFAADWSPSGDLVASTGARDVWVWEARTGRAVVRHPAGNRFTSRPALAFSPDGKSLAWSEGPMLLVFDLDVKQVMKFMNHRSGDITSVAWSPDSKRLSTSSNGGTVRIWDTEQSQELLRLDGHGTAVECVAWSPNGQHLLSGSSDRTIRIWRADEGYREAQAATFHVDQAVIRQMQAQSLLQNGILGPAQAELTELPPDTSNDWSVWEMRGQLHLGLGEFDKAAPCYARARELARGRETFSLLANDALLQLQLGSVESYQDDCLRLVELVNRNEHDQLLKIRAAFICAIRPDTHLQVDGVDELYDQVSQIVEGDAAYMQISRLWVELRLGKYEQVLENRDIEFQWGFQERAFEGSLILLDVIANAHLGRRERAETAMKRATQLWELQREVAIDVFGYGPFDWMFHLVYHEAHELLQHTGKVVEETQSD